MEMNYHEMFSKETKILISDMVKYTLSHRDKKTFLFPVFLYKVVLPNLSKKELNFFQKTILEILSFQNASSDFISKKLLLNEDLVKYIFNELDEAGYYKKGLVTESGKKALRNIYDPSETIIGYCIYDLLCERFMDYFILENDLESMQIEHSSYKPDRVILQKKISEKVYRAYIIKTVNDEINDIELRKEDIYKSYMNYIKNYKKYNIKDVVSMADSSLINNEISIDKIKFINREPIPYYLATYLYYNSSNTNRGILVSDPFFEKIYFHLRDFIENYKNRYNNIMEMYSELSPSKISDLDIVKKSEEKIKEFEKEMHNIFEIDFIKNHKKLIEEAFYNLFNSYKLLNPDDPKNSNVSTKMKSQEDFIEYLNKAFEYIFHYNIFNMGCNIKVNNVLSSDFNSNARILIKIASNIGFYNENNTMEIFFSKVYAGRIFSKNGILKGDIEDIVSLSAANLLISLNNTNFKNLANEYDNLFSILFEINSIRAAKYHDDFKNLNNEEIKKYFKYFLGILSVLFNTSVNYKYFLKADKKDKNIQNYDEYKNELLSASDEVIDILGNNIKNYPALFDYLESMQYNLNNNYDVYIKIAKIFENIFKIIIEQLGLESVFNSVREELIKDDKSFIDDIEAYLISIGFNIDNAFPDFLINRWKGDRVYKRVSQEVHQVFSDLLMILIIYSKLNPYDDILKKIAKAEPNFINYSLRYGNRHHNTALSKDRHILNFESYKQAADKTYLCVKAVIDIIENN